MQKLISSADVVSDSLLITFEDGKVLLLQSEQLYDWAIPESELLRTLDCSEEGGVSS
jgi:hypothetical protein